MTILCFGIALLVELFVLIIMWFEINSLKLSVKRLRALEKARQIFYRDWTRELASDLDDIESRLEEK